MRNLLLALVILTIASTAAADAIRQTKGDFNDVFRQLSVDLPTANVYRTSSGAPGQQYWQQQADYKISVALNEKTKRINGTETITYTNNSPDTLRYLWLQLEQNRFAQESLAHRSETASQASGRQTWQGRTEEGKQDILTYYKIAQHQLVKDNDYGYNIEKVAARGRDLSFTIVDSMMRIDLPLPLKSGQRFTFSVDWSFHVVRHERLRAARGGYEHFPDNDTYIYSLAQWFPRMAAYTDYAGWQHKSFLGTGEFVLEFGDYEVDITVPDDHIVSATGELQNPDDVLAPEQRRRLNDARHSDRPIFIITPEEAKENERVKSTGTKTWRFKAQNVRDFAWSSSRKFLWDAMIHRQDDPDNPEVLVMSFYPQEAEPIWSKYSTLAVLHALEVYSRFSFNYPYPTAQSVNTWKRGGMEYPMITFTGYRPEPLEAEEGEIVKGAPDRTYSRRVKYNLITVIIHEIGHIYFPMTVNSDERQWLWMDEGINTFLEYLAVLEWQEQYPVAFQSEHVNVLDFITEYMVSDDQVPIMTNSDSIRNTFENAYAKPTAALAVLRETVMGRELFDFAFKEYSQRWKFKRPGPADFFRTMEDASGIDLDWFWRGWFYTTEHVDVNLKDVREYKVSSTNPDVESAFDRQEYADEVPETLTEIRNRQERRKSYLERFPELADFYNKHDRFTPSNKDRNEHAELLDSLEDWEYKALQRAVKDNEFVYFVDFENLGGLVTPLPLEITFSDGSREFLMIPAEIWRRDYRNVSKLLIRDRAITSIALDPRHQTADADYTNNYFPRRMEKSRIELYRKEQDDKDLMRDMLNVLRERKGGKKGEPIRSVPLH